jgi:hypothetical protein
MDLQHLQPISSVTSQSNPVASHGVAARPAQPNQEDGSREQGSPAQSTDDKGRLLDRWDVFSLMVNQMIGVGILIHPPLVLWFCGNKHLALWMWLVGGLITALRFVVDDATTQ